MIYDGQDAKQVDFNNAFVSRIVDTSLIGRLSLNNLESGERIKNLQKLLNIIINILGISEDVENNNDYHSQNYISSEDNRKQAISKLDEELKNLSNSISSSKLYSISVGDNEEITIPNDTRELILFLSGTSESSSLSITPFTENVEHIRDGMLINLIGLSDEYPVRIIAADVDGGYLGERGDIELSRGSSVTLIYNSATKRFYGV